MNKPEEKELVVSAKNVVRRFGRLDALKGLSMDIPEGCVFGLVGENGAGKTTFIRTLLGLIRPHGGEVKVFGVDPVSAPVSALSRIGYLSEDRDLPDWMSLWELIRYTRAFYPNWDDDFADELMHTFGLDLNWKVKNLSRGQRAQAGLLVALAYRPELLILDEPSSGLDPAVRRDILGAIIRTVAEEGRTVLFSSHFLDEVERVSDYIAMIHQGVLIWCDTLEGIKAMHHRLVLRLPESVAPSQISGQLSAERTGSVWTTIHCSQRETLLARIHELDGEILEHEPPSLEEIFVARVGSDRGVRGREAS